MANNSGPHSAKYHNHVMKSITRAVSRSGLLTHPTGYKYPIIVPEEYSLERALEVANQILIEKFSQYTNIRFVADVGQYGYFFIVIN